MIRISVLLTCVNRQELTLHCLGNLASQKLPVGHRIETTLVDDGPTDGTSATVSANRPEMKILHGDGNLY
jgi:GT2 family glycosyltransferase